MQLFSANAEIFLKHFWFWFFFANEKLKKSPSKVAKKSFCWAVSLMPKTAWSAQTKKVQGLLELFGALCIYISG